MFTYEEDTEEATRLAIETVGPMGRALEYSTSNSRKDIVINARLSTKSHGEFWYGDIDIKNDLANIDKLSSLLKEQVEISPPR